MSIQHSLDPYTYWTRKVFGKIMAAEPRRSNMEDIKVIDGIKHEKVYDFKATSFTENGKWVKGEVQFTWMNEKYRSQPGEKIIEIGSHNGRYIESSGSPCCGFSRLFIPGERKDFDGNVITYHHINDFDRDVAALTACQYVPVKDDKPKMLDATLKAIEQYVLDREAEVRRINGVIEQLVGLMEKRPQDICDQFMGIKGKDQYDTVDSLPQHGSTCPHCIEHRGDCGECEYAKAHNGECSCNPGGDWLKMRKATSALCDAIEKAYPFEDED